jgi:hypothetical protein
MLLGPALKLIGSSRPLQLSITPVQCFQCSLWLDSDWFCFSEARHTLWPPILGQRSIRPSDIFPLIQQPSLLFDAWKPTKTLDAMDLKTLWANWNEGEAVVDANGDVTGMKPSLRSIEQHFSSKWRSEGRVSWNKSQWPLHL